MLVHLKALMPPVLTQVPQLSCHLALVEAMQSFGAFWWTLPARLQRPSIWHGPHSNPPACGSRMAPAMRPAIRGRKWQLPLRTGA